MKKLRTESPQFATGKVSILQEAVYPITNVHSDLSIPAKQAFGEVGIAIKGRVAMRLYEVVPEAWQK